MSELSFSDVRKHDEVTIKVITGKDSSYTVTGVVTSADHRDYCKTINVSGFGIDFSSADYHWVTEETGDAVELIEHKRNERWKGNASVVDASVPAEPYYSNIRLLRLQGDPGTIVKWVDERGRLWETNQLSNVNPLLDQGGKTYVE